MTTDFLDLDAITDPGERLELIKDDETRLVIDLRLQPYRAATLLTTDDEIRAARRLHAEVYLAHDYITAEDIDEDGTIRPGVDPYVAASTYFGVSRDGGTRATARRIAFDDPDRLPALGLDDLDPGEVARIRTAPAGTAVEISGLARGTGALSSDVVAVYARMWQDSLDHGHRVWVMAVDVRVFNLLRAMICGNSVRQIGPAQDYLGSSVVPAVLWMDEMGPEQLRMAREARDPGRFATLLPYIFGRPAWATR